MLKLIDSSTWIDYIRGIDNKQTKILHKEIENGGNIICICPIIIQEVLQGFKDDLAYQKFKKLFLNINTLVLPEPEPPTTSTFLFLALVGSLGRFDIMSRSVCVNITLFSNFGSTKGAISSCVPQRADPYSVFLRNFLAFLPLT